MAVAVLSYGILTSTAVWKRADAEIRGAGAVFLVVLTVLLGTMAFDNPERALEGIIYQDNLPVSRATVVLLEATAANQADTVTPERHGKFRFAAVRNVGRSVRLLVDIPPITPFRQEVEYRPEALHVINVPGPRLAAGGQHPDPTQPAESTMTSVDTATFVVDDSVSAQPGTTYALSADSIAELVSSPAVPSYRTISFEVDYRSGAYSRRFPVDQGWVIERIVDVQTSGAPRPRVELSPDSTSFAVAMPSYDRRRAIFGIPVSRGVATVSVQLRRLE